MHGHEPGRGPKPDDAAERRGQPQRAAEIRALARGRARWPGRRRAAGGAPGVRAGFHGLRVTPKTALNVLAPAPNSGVLVLPTTMAPAPSAARRPARPRPARDARRSCCPCRADALRRRESLIDTGTPCSGPGRALRRLAAVVALRAARAPARRRRCNRRSARLTRSSRASTACTTSSGDTRRGGSSAPASWPA